jgi:hypothetical protein
MADNPLETAVETFSAPIESVIVALGRGIAEAQAALDQNSIKTQEALDTDPVLSHFGLQATWYQFPRVDLQLKLALTVTEERTATPQAGPTAVGPIARLALARPVRLVAQPVSAAYQNHFNYNAQASSQITLSIVPVPPPRAADQAAIAPRLGPDEVQKAALSSSAKFATTTDPTGNPIPDPKLRFDINFNAAARAWYVLQYDPADPTAKAVVVTVDDATGSVRVISA